MKPACRTVTPEREVSSEAQRLDLWCDPDPERLHAIGHFHLLRRMLQGGPCAFEFFHAAPTLSEVLGCLRKTLFLRHPGGESIVLWIIAAGRPDKVFNELPSLLPIATWPAGTYGLDRGLGLRMIVTSELPRSADTLLFRLLGARRTLRDALLELDQLPANDALCRTARPIVVRLLGDVRENPSAPEQQEFVMETEEYYEKWQNERRAEGEASALVTFLRARDVPVSAEAAARIEGTTDRATLGRWLVRAATVSSVEELFEP